MTLIELHEMKRGLKNKDDIVQIEKKVLEELLNSAISNITTK